MTTKKQKQRNFIIVLLVIGFIVLASQGNLPFSIGSSTLSISNANLRSSNPFFSGKAWLLTFTRGTLAQSYFGDFSPSDIQSRTSGDETTKHDFTVSVDYSDTKCVYDLQGVSTNTPIYDLDAVSWTYVPIFNPCTLDESKSRLQNVLIYGASQDFLQCVAIGYNTLSPVSNIDSPDVESQFTVSVNVRNGPSAIKSFNTLSGVTNGFLGDFAYLEWQGNLVSGQSCPDKDPFKGAYVNGKWRTISNSKYLTYKSLFDSLNPLVGTRPSLNEINSRVEAIKSASFSAKLSKSFGNIKNSYSKSDGRIEITTQTPIEFPLTTLYLKSDSVGVFTPTPDIVFDRNPTSQCFASGSGNGLISLDLKNIGDQRGGFSVGADCPSPFFVTNVQGTLEAGESRHINLPLSGSGSSKIENQCSVFLEVLGDVKRKNVGVCVDPLVTCTVPFPKKFCGTQGNSDVIKQCSQDGATSKIIETCGSNQFCEAGVCEDTLGGGSTPGISDKIKVFFSDLFNGVFDFLKILKYLIVFVSGFIATFFSRDFLSGLKPFKRKEGAVKFLSIVIGIGVGAILINFIGGTIFWMISGGIVILTFLDSFFLGGAIRKTARRFK